MALRHPFPQCDLPDLRLPAEPDKAPPIPKRPKQVRFRPGQDMAQVVSEFVGFTYVNLQASVGAGKSTSIPAQLAVSSGKPVYHMVPHRLGALLLHKHLSKKGMGVELKLARSPEEEFSTTGVTITTYACVVAKLLINRNVAEPLGDVILYADEIHESDAYTYVMSKLGPNLPGITAYVAATATPAEEGYPMRETKGKVTSKKMPKVLPRDWHVLDKDAPWSVLNQTGNLLIFVDNDTVAERLVSEYNGAGVTAYRVTARSSDELMLQANERMEDPRAGITVLIADYSFRNCFDFLVDTILESGEVKYYVVKDGVTTAKYRVVYDLENYQAMGRGGRREGTEVVCWNPDVQFRKAICMLEGVEMEAAAVLFRSLGYAVPAEIRSQATFAAATTIPRDLVHALNTFVAISVQPADSMMELVYERPATPDTVETMSPEDVLDSYADESRSEGGEDYFHGHATLDTVAVPYKVLDSTEFLEQLRSVTAATDVLEWPNYYACHGLDLTDNPIPRYQDNWEAAVFDILKMEYMALSFTVEERKLMISRLLLQYNRCVLQVSGAQRVLRVKTSLTSLSLQHPTLVGSWSDWLVGLVRKNEALGKSTLAAVDRLREPLMQFVAVPPDKQAELEIAESMADRLRSVVGKARQAVDARGIFNAIRGVDGMGGLEQPGDVHFLEAGAAGVADVDKLQVTMRPIRVGDRAMHDVTLSAATSVVWTEEDYVYGMSRLLSDRGYSVSGVRRLMLPGSKVDPGRVLQKLRDRGIAKHRGKATFTVKMLPQA